MAGFDLSTEARTAGQKFRGPTQRIVKSPTAAEFSRLLRLPENAGVASMGDTKAGGPFDVSGDQARVWASACRRTRTAGPTHRQNHAGRLREKHGRSREDRALRWRRHSLGSAITMQWSRQTLPSMQTTRRCRARPDGRPRNAHGAASSTAPRTSRETPLTLKTQRLGHDDRHRAPTCPRTGASTPRQATAAPSGSRPAGPSPRFIGEVDQRYLAVRAPNP